MRTRLLVLFEACAFLAAAATATAQGTKWHPGHYVMLNPREVAEHTEQIAEVGGDTTIQGFMVRFWWHDLEPDFNQYDFSLIDSYFAQLRQLPTTKRLVVRIMDRSFTSSDGTDVVPDYLREDPVYNGGILFSRERYVARLWEAPVMDRLVSLYQALARRYDSEPLFEGAFTEETTLGITAADFPPGYSHERLADQYVRFIKAVKPTMPKSNLFLNANWIGSPTIMATLIQEVRDATVGAGGSNVSVGKPTQGQQVVNGTSGADYRLELAIASGVESADLGPHTPEEIGTYAYNTLKAHYLFWVRKWWGDTPEENWDTGILPYLRSGPPIRTRCPNVYGICATSDPPGTGTPKNAPPTVSAGADTSAASPDVTVMLAGSVTDDGLPGSPVTVVWSQVTGPASAEFVDVRSPTSQVSLPSAGTYVLRLTASDGELSASDEVTVAVAAANPPPPPENPPPAPENQPPEVDAGGDVILQSPAASVALVGTVTDDDLPSAEVSLQWSVVSGPSPAVFDAADSASTRATFSSPGVYALRLTASDGELSTSDDVTVTVSEAGSSGADGPSDGGGPSGGGQVTPPAPPPSGGGGGAVGIAELLCVALAVLLRRCAQREHARRVTRRR